MSKLLDGVKYWGQLFTVPLYCLSHLVPRDKNIWVFGSTFGKRFSDNPRYFYLYLNQNHINDVKAIWISKDKKVAEELQKKGYPAFYLFSKEGIWYSLRAKVYLYDNYAKDICFLLSGGAIKINMWHGIPLKKINMDNIFDKVRHPENNKEKFRWILRRMSDEKPSHYVLTTSQFLKSIFSSAFNTRKVIINGYPRNDIIIGNIKENLLTKEESNVIDIINNQKKNKKVMLYMPTFRESEIDFFNIVDLSLLEKFLVKENIYLCVKLHPKSKLYKKFEQIERKNILIINPMVDPYSILSLTDKLITDYSSIYFDYLLLNKPIVFFHYDMDKYLKESREFYFDYYDYTPGRKVTDMTGLISALLEDDIYYEEREKIKNLMFDKPKVCSSARLYEYIKKIISRSR